jgi:acyl carrier protein
MTGFSPSAPKLPMDNRERIIAIVKSVSKKSAVPDAEESLFDSGFLDSFALPDVVSELEREFQIKIPDSDLNPHKFESIARIENYIESRK